MRIWLPLNGCCYCLSLRAGSLIILWLGLIYASWGLVDAIYGLPEVKAPPEMILFSLANCAGVAVLGIVPCALALYGVYARISGYLKLYVFVSFVTIICWVSVTIALIFKWIQLDHHKDSIASVCCAILFVGTFHWYFTSVVYSYYRQLNESQEEHPIITTTTSNVPKG